MTRAILFVMTALLLVGCATGSDTGCVKRTASEVGTTILGLTGFAVELAVPFAGGAVSELVTEPAASTIPLPSCYTRSESPWVCQDGTRQCPPEERTRLLDKEEETKR